MHVQCCSQAFSPSRPAPPPPPSLSQGLSNPPLAVPLWPMLCSACYFHFYFYLDFYFYFLYSGESAAEHAWLEDHFEPARHQWPYHQLPAITHPQDLPGAAS